MTEATKGVLAMVGACVIWGFSALYYKLLSDITSSEVLAHRTIWSAVCCVIVLSIQSRLGELRVVLSNKRSLSQVFAAAVLVSTNWYFLTLVHNRASLEDLVYRALATTRL